MALLHQARLATQEKYPFKKNNCSEKNNYTRFTYVFLKLTSDWKKTCFGSRYPKRWFLSVRRAPFFGLHHHALFLFPSFRVKNSLNRSWIQNHVVGMFCSYFAYQYQLIHTHKKHLDTNKRNSNCWLTHINKRNLVQQTDLLMPRIFQKTCEALHPWNWTARYPKEPFLKRSYVP